MTIIASSNAVTRYRESNDSIFFSTEQIDSNRDSCSSNFYRATPCKSDYANVLCSSVRPFVGVWAKWLNVGKRKQHCTVAQTVVFWHQRSGWNSNGITSTGASDASWGRLKWAIFDQYIAICQKRCKQGHRYYIMLMRTCIRSIEWCYFQWPWVT